MEIISYNVNGIRAAINKGLVSWLKEGLYDIVCLQETKAQPDQVDMSEIQSLGYHDYWFSAQKKGYSGVLIATKEIPISVKMGCGHELFDFEGRVIQADYKDFTLCNIYFPSGTAGTVRQDVKYEFLAYIFDYLMKLKSENKHLIVCGDFNIAHHAYDIHNPKSNKNSSGFLPEERAWMTKYFENGFIDTFRLINGDMPDQYSWWSYRAGARGNNKGWRIDYLAVSDSLKDQVADAKILMDVVHSDHCPIYLNLNL